MINHDIVAVLFIMALLILAYGVLSYALFESIYGYWSKKLSFGLPTVTGRGMWLFVVKSRRPLHKNDVYMVVVAESEEAAKGYIEMLDANVLFLELLRATPTRLVARRQVFIELMRGELTDHSEPERWPGPGCYGKVLKNDMWTRLFIWVCPNHRPPRP
jgi:hypothetical protein